MSNKQIMTRIQLLAGTRAEWEVKGNVVLLPNEYAVTWESRNAETGSYSGLIGIKLGDGVTTWSNLKYLDQDLKDIIATLDASIAKEIADFKAEFVSYKNNQATINNMQAQSDAALLTKIQKNRDDLAAEVAAREALAAEVANGNEEIAQEIADFKTEFTGYKNDMANLHNSQAQTDAALLTKIQKNREDIAANKAAQDAVNAGVEAHFEEVEATIVANKNAQDEVNAAQAETNATLNAGIEKNASDLAAHKENVATIHNMQAQNDAILMDKIRENRQNIAANKAAQDEVNAGVAADIEAVNAAIDAHVEEAAQIHAAQAETNATLAADIAKNAEDLVAHKNNMAEIHNMQAQTDAALLGKIQENRQNIAAEVARATAAEEANAAEIAKVDSVLKAALDNNGEGLDSIKELATWVEAHGKEAEAIVKSVEDEAAARKAADEQLSKDIAAATEASDAADEALAKDIADFKSEFTGYKNEQAQIHNMQAQNDAALLVKIQQNRENLANEVAAREALEATALQTVSTGVGLKAAKTGTDAKIEIDDSVVFILNCGNATDL
jgi:hypothetical protein